MLDLVRILASVSPSLAAYRSPSGASIVQVALAAADWSKPWVASKERETNTMLAFRALANLFSTSNGKEALLAEPGCEEVSHAIALTARTTRHVRHELIRRLFWPFLVAEEHHRRTVVSLAQQEHPRRARHRRPQVRFVALVLALSICLELTRLLLYSSCSYSVLALQSGLPRNEIGNLLLEIILRVSARPLLSTKLLSALTSCPPPSCLPPDVLGRGA